MTKTRKFRGSRTYGRGRGRSHNYGAGNRGGRGRAGSGKKGDAKKTKYWKNPFKKAHFGMNSSEEASVINVGQIEERIEALSTQGKVKADKKISLDLNKLGYEKLLGTGAIKFPITVSVKSASKKAIEKVQAAGGEVIILEK